MQIFYTVRTGDTLGSIAMRWQIPLNSLIQANNIAALYVIYPGQQLSMPPGVTTYVVKPGDSVYAISQRYGIPMRTIIEANGIAPPYIILPGAVLIIPTGVPFYVVRSGDTLYKIAVRYNVVLDGSVRPDLILAANPGLTPAITPGMTIAIPYPPPGGQGLLAAVISDGFGSFITLYDPASGNTRSIAVDEADRAAIVFWSPDRSKIALITGLGILSIIDTASGRITKIDQSSLPAFASWSSDSRRLVYSTGSLIRIYNASSNTFTAINRAGASYVQWSPDDREMLFEAKDTNGISQLYRMNADGSNVLQITNNSNGAYNNMRLSPNGAYVLYTTPGVSISEIYTIELATGITYKIPGGPAAKNYYPSWSPDSTRVAYSASSFINGKYYSYIRVSGRKGENDTSLAIASCYASPVAWSPDGRKIAYLSGCREDAPPVEMWSIDLAKPVPVNLLSGFFFYNLDW